MYLLLRYYCIYVYTINNRAIWSLLSSLSSDHMATKIHLMTFCKHLGLFLVVEIIFALIIFREIPETNLLTMIGILHSSYWLIVIIAWLVRQSYTHKLWQKFLCTYVPILYHVAIHVYAGVVTIEHMHGHDHTEHSTVWIWLGVVCAWILIALGEYRLHRSIHCQTHHMDAHAHCHDWDCEQIH